MLRASKDGTKLEVTSVNNEHNHEISEVCDLFYYFLHYIVDVVCACVCMCMYVCRGTI